MTMLLQRIGESEPLDTSRGFGAVESEFGNLPLRQLSYHARMLGLAVRTTILQSYYNPFDEAIEAKYIFPLEYGQAVIACEMRIGERVVTAQLKERAEARAEYAQAIRNGYRAALLEENRPETFSMAVGNIPPGEAIQICIQTVSQLAVVSGEWTLRLPLVVAPRYTSGLPLPRAACGPGTASDTAQVPDASTVTPPTWLPGFASPVDLSLIVDMDLAQLPCRDDWIMQLKSSLHTALIEAHSDSVAASGGRTCRVQLLPGERVDRDFILRGQLNDDFVSSAIVCETNSESQPAGTAAAHTTFAITMVAPRKPLTTIPNQVVYLLDRSGSMSGWKMQAARRGMCRLLDRLDAKDSFQLVAFDDKLDVYQSRANKPNRSAWIAADDAQRFEAIRWLSQVESEGGTEMAQAVEFALKACCVNETNFELNKGVCNPAIVLVTDGHITGEDSLLRLIDSMPTDRVPRLFCLGVDRAVNASVLQRISRRTGGTFELVESEQRLDEVLARFADEIASPALTALSITSQPKVDLHIAPNNLTTLYSGRAQTIYGRYAGDQPLTLSVRGQLTDGKPYEQQLQVSPSGKISSATGNSTSEPTLLRALWGKETIRTLEDNLFAAGSHSYELKQQIIDCSLRCSVLSRLTAYIAVDRTEKVTDGHKPHSILNPSELPEGWSRNLVRLNSSSLVHVPRYNSGSTLPRESSPALAAGSTQAATHLLQAGKISAEQLMEAQKHAAQRGMDVCGALIDLQYTTHEAVAQSLAALTKTTYVSVRQLQIDESIIQLVPESVARECHVLPIADSHAALTVVLADPFDLETVEKLRFILNRNVQAFCGAYDEIEQAIHRHYGAVEGESADSILQEFTDTQIDFTETTYGNYLPIDGLSMDDASMGFAPPSPAAARQRFQKTRGSAEPEVVFEDITADMYASEQSFGASPPPVDAPIVRLVGLLFQEAIQLRATHIIANLVNDAVEFAYVIDGKLVQRDRAPRRLWFMILNQIMLLAKLDFNRRGEIQTGTIPIAIGSQQAEGILHTACARFMIELPEAKKFTVVPEAIEQWWAEVRQLSSAETQN